MSLINFIPTSVCEFAAGNCHSSSSPLTRLFANRTYHNEFLLTTPATLRGSAEIHPCRVYLERRRGDSMRAMGILATVALAVLGAAAATLTLAAIPDINRYLRIRRM
jgi:hypothetical protein